VDFGYIVLYARLMRLTESTGAAHFLVGIISHSLAVPLECGGLDTVTIPANG
jgi:hypothetical protein